MTTHEFPESQCNGVSITQLCDAVDNFSFAAQAWEDEDVQMEEFTRLAAMLNKRNRATLIFALLTQGNTQGGESLSPTDKENALELAMLMGPDWAQWLYRFTVLCTKLA